MRSAARVRIPPSPPNTQKTRYLSGFLFCLTRFLHDLFTKKHFLNDFIQYFDSPFLFFWIEMGIGVPRHFDPGMSETAGYFLNVDPGICQKGGVRVPLRYNKDKRKNPVFSRVSAFVVAYSIPFPTLIVNEKSVE